MNNLKRRSVFALISGLIVMASIQTLIYFEVFEGFFDPKRVYLLVGVAAVSAWFASSKGNVD